MSTSQAVIPTPNDRRTYPLYSWRFKSPSRSLIYITDHNDANRLLSALPHGPIGFDLEWKPCYSKDQPENRVALVQLATADCILLLHVCKMEEIPTGLRDVLRGLQWTKVGVNIQYDCKKLHKDYYLHVCNCVDLSLMARSVDNARWKGRYTNPIGLARLLETYHGTTLHKGKVQRSNWELYLSPNQQNYAANDAHSAYVIYTCLQEIAQTMSPPPLPVWYSFSCVGGQLYDRVGHFAWAPENPNYDPGPPPPPKDKNPENDQNQSSPGKPGPTIADAAASVAESSMTPIASVLPRNTSSAIHNGNRSKGRRR
ncbi:ribonuclease H-like domain-containing protein [Pisolithus marmoratus]|nr:ribonuclease H-like domain-containing protein [Pisolithus marmoratus]